MPTNKLLIKKSVKLKSSRKTITKRVILSSQRTMCEMLQLLTIRFRSAIEADKIAETKFLTCQTAVSIKKTSRNSELKKAL